MRFQSQGRHVIDFIFPISLFFVFAASSLAVIILAANIYSSSTARSESDDQTRIALSYITEKIRQNDELGNIDIEKIEGTDCLVLTGDYNGTVCVTYVYEYDGMLKELFIKKGTSVSLDDGKDIISSDGLTMEKLEDHLYQFSCTDKNGAAVTSLAAERSLP